MKKFYAYSLCLTALFFTSHISAQNNVGIGTNVPDASAVLELKASNKGLLIPRLPLISVTDVVTVPGPAVSVLVYNTNPTISGGTGLGFYYWDGARWQSLSVPASGGPTGPTGAPGMNGPAGPGGAAGTNGTNGATGATGAAGTNGTNGATGATGATGMTGNDGATGATGFTGAAGTNGTNGTNGIAGTNGANGATGATGVTGNDGATGATGSTGTAGTNGTNGTNGIAGTNGANGATGATGMTGNDGATGATGSTGAAGTNGTNGTNGIAGTNGANGATGATGVTGNDGATGATGSTGAAGTNGTNGTNGIAGTNGANGATGAAGVTGNDGATGATGSTGAAGTNGTNGTNGIAGTNGANGATGATGVTGNDGATGAAGTNGTNGIAGTNGANGATGATGATGTAGTNGATGATGLQGIVGLAGSIGPTGLQGNVGATGTAGIDGSTGATGATGPAGAMGTAGGDLSGTYPNPTVVGLQGTPVSNTPPATNNILEFNGTSWIPANPNSLFWKITGNTTTTPSTSAIGTAVNNNFIGTIDNKDFVVATNNLERMRVTAAGCVGIGAIPANNTVRLAVSDNVTTMSIIPGYRGAVATANTVTFDLPGLGSFYIWDNLEVSNAATVDNLAGTGNRNVMANASGTLIINPTNYAVATLWGGVDVCDIGGTMCGTNPSGIISGGYSNQSSSSDASYHVNLNTSIANYTPTVTIVIRNPGNLTSNGGGSGQWNNDNDVFCSVGNLNPTGFDVFFREVATNTQNLRIECTFVVKNF